MTTRRRPEAVRRWHWGQSLDPLREVLEAGGVLAIPTESSYGLAVDPRNLDGVETIYTMKRRERGKPLLVVVADLAQAEDLGVVVESTERELLERWWPAPLTAVLPLRSPLAAAAGGATLAVRVPAHRGLRELLSELGCGVTATSANHSGEPPVVDPEDLDELLGERPGSSPAIIIDDGRLPGGPPSTLVSWQDGEMAILRQGAFPAAEMAAVRPNG